MLYTYLYVMLKKTKINLIIIISAIAVLITIGVIANNIAVSKIKNQLAALPAHIDFKYNDLNVNILSGTFCINQMQTTIRGKVTDSVKAQIACEQIKIKGFSVYNFLVNNTINLDKLSLLTPNVTYYHNASATASSLENFLRKQQLNAFTIDALAIDNGSVAVISTKTDSLMLSADTLNIKLSDVSSQKLQENPNDIFKTIKGSCKAVTYAMSDFEMIKINALTYNPNAVNASGIALKTKYPKSEYSKYLKTQRDHFNLEVSELVVRNPEYTYNKVSKSFFKSGKIDIIEPYLKIYRNTLLPEDSTPKPLYSKMLRDLETAITLDSVNIVNANVYYSEKSKLNTLPSDIHFSKINATITNLNTIKTINTAKTNIAIDGFFMDDTPLEIVWDFDINDADDQFVFKSTIGSLQAESLDSFIIPSANTRLEGKINKLFFTTSGGDNYSKTDLKLAYKNLNVIVLKDDGKEKNKFLSKLINLIIPENSQEDSGAYRYGTAEHIQRDKTKSIFNFIWMGLRTALLNAIAGDGEKPESD